MDMEWQTHCENEWAFGLKIRGIIRDRVAEVYFNEDCWVWFVLDKDERGTASNLSDAIEACEKVLGVI